MADQKEGPSRPLIELTPEQAAQIAELRDKEFHAYATAMLFERRMNGLRRRLRNLNFVGLVIPVSIGGLVGAFGLKWQMWETVLALAGVAALIQGVVSVWAIFSKWEDGLLHAQEAMIANLNHSTRYGRFKDTLIRGGIEALDRTELALLDQAAEAQGNTDRRSGVTEEEKCFGMRATLRQFQRPCAGCNEVPLSLKPTDCPVCGQF